MNGAVSYTRGQGSSGTREEKRSTLLQIVLLALLVALAGIEVRRRWGGGLEALELDQNDLLVLRKVLLVALVVAALAYLMVLAASGVGPRAL